MLRFFRVQASFLSAHRFWLVGVAFVLAACDQPPPPAPESFLPENKLKVVVTTSQLAELARQVGGEAVNVECLMAPKTQPPTKSAEPKPDSAGAPPKDEEKPVAAEAPAELPWNPNPYAWQITASDIFTMRTASVVLVNGLGLEQDIEPHLLKLREEGISAVSIGAALPPEEIIRPSGPSGTPDPHIWNSPRLWQMAAEAVANAMKAAVRPEAGPYFDTRAHQVQVGLIRTMEWTKERLSSRPVDQRALLTTHDTLRYFGRDFGVETRAIWHANGQPIEQTNLDLENWLDAKGIADLVPENAAPADVVSEVAVHFRLGRSPAIHTLMLGKPGTQQLGLLEAFDIGTLDGAFRSFIRTVERRLGGGKRLDADLSEPPPPKAHPVSEENKGTTSTGENSQPEAPKQ